MEEQKKSRKPLIVGIIAAVVVLAALLALVLTQFLGSGPSEDPSTDTTAPVAQSYDLYWNVDRNNLGTVIDGTTNRKPADDGFYHMVFAIDGKQVELRVKERRLVNIIDSFDLMGLVFDENGDVIDIVRVDDMPVEKVFWQYYIQSFGGNAIKLNSSKDFAGMEEVIKINENTKIYDVSGWSEYVGAPGKLQKSDRVYTIANEDGEITHIFLYERDGIQRSYQAMCKHCGEEVTWNNWMLKDSLPIVSGHYFLEQDIEAKGQNMIGEAQKICLDLNGYTVHSTQKSRIYSTFNPAGQLAVMDNSEGTPGKFVSEGKGMDQGCCLWVRYGSIDIYDITVDGSKATTRTGGTAITVAEGAIATLHSGTLIGGETVKVEGKTSSQYGATVLVNGTFTMHNGLITGGISHSNGGNVCVASKGTFTMNGGTISRGRAYRNEKNANGYGGNVYILGTFNMNGGTITGGRCYNYDGTPVEAGTNIYASQNVFSVNGDLYMYGGKIAGHMLARDTDLTDDNPCIVYLSGTAKITGGANNANLTLYTGTTIRAGKLRKGAEIRVTTSGIFSNKTVESNVQYVHSDVEGANVVYYQECLAIGRSQCACGASVTGASHMGSCDGTLEFFGPFSGPASIPASGGNFYLTKDYEDISQLICGSAAKKDADGNTIPREPVIINLDMNGHTIESSVRSMLVYTDSIVNISDSVGGGKLIGKGYTSSTQAGTVLIQNGGTVNVYGDVTLTTAEDHVDNLDRSGVVEIAGTLNMYHGTILGTDVNKSGGSVYIQSTGVMNLYNDVVIKGGTAADSGGNVYCAGEVNIYDNASVTGGKVLKASQNPNADLLFVNGKLNMYGGHLGLTQLTNSGRNGCKLVVAGNAKIDSLRRYIYNSATSTTKATEIVTVEILDALGDEAKIVLYEPEKGVFSNETVAENADNFSTTNGLAVTYSEDHKKLAVGEMHANLYHCICGMKHATSLTDTNITSKGDCFGACTGEIKEWIQWTGTTLPNEAGYWYISEDYTTTGQALLKQGSVFVDLNGKTVTAKSNTRAYVFGSYTADDSAVQENVALTIMDSGNGGTIVNAENDAVTNHGMLFWNFTNMTPVKNPTLNIYGGHLDASKVAGSTTNTSSYGPLKGAINIDPGTTGGSAIINMYGGKVSGMHARNKNDAGNGGAFYLYSTTTMNISGNAEIVGGTATQYGGAIYNNGGILNISGNAKITGGTAAQGGGIYSTGSTGKITVSGNAAITGNTANWGAGVRMHNGSLEIAGGTITGNTCTGDGASSSDVYLVSGSVIARGGVIGKIRAQAGKTITVNNAPVIQALDLKGTEQILLEENGALTSDASISVLNGVGTKLGGTELAPYTANFHALVESTNVVADADGVWIRVAISDRYPILYHCDCGMQQYDAEGNLAESKGSCADGCDGTNRTWMPLENKAMLADAKVSGNYYLVGDLELDSQVVVGADNATEAVVVRIDLNGYSINSTSRVFQLRKYGALTLTNTAAQNHENGGMVTGMGASGNYGVIQTYMSGYNATTNPSYMKLTVLQNVTLKPGADDHYLQSSGTLGISNGAEANFYGCTIYGTKTGGNGAAMVIRSGSTVKLQGVTVYGADALNGGAISNNATLTIQDSTIHGGKVNRDTTAQTGGCGGALHLIGGTTVIDNSVINGGFADEMDAANATEEDKMYGGSAIYASAGTVEIKNGSQINGYTAEHSNYRRGGTIYVGGTAEMILDSAIVSASKVKIDGAALLINGADAEFTMSGSAQIVGSALEQTQENVACVAVMNGGKFTISGGAVKPAEAPVASQAIGVRADNGTVEIAGNGMITGFTGGNIYLTNIETAKVVVGELTTGASYGITLGTTDGTGIFTETVVDDATYQNIKTNGYITSDNGNFAVERHESRLAIMTAGTGNGVGSYVPYVERCMCGASEVDGAEHKLGCDQVEYQWLPYAGQTDIKESVNYYLDKNWTGEDKLQAPITLNINSNQDEGPNMTPITVRFDLNGYDLESAKRVFQPYWNATLWLCNSNPGTDGNSIMGAGQNNNHSAVIQPVYAANNCHVKMFEGVTLKKVGTNTITKAGVLQVRGGSFEMFGGTIEGTTVAGEGGAVHIYGGGTFTMHNGVIKNGVSTGGKGGNVHVDAGIFDMRGGAIEGGSVSLYKGTNAEVSMKVSGAVKIDALDLGCAEGKTMPVVTVEGVLTDDDAATADVNEGAQIIVTSVGQITTATDAQNVNNFISRYGHTVAQDAGGAIVIDGTSPAQWCLCGASITGGTTHGAGCNGTVLTWTPIDAKLTSEGSVTLAESGNYYLTQSLSRTDQITVGGSNAVLAVNIDLNGYNITSNKNRVLLINPGATVTVTNNGMATDVLGVLETTETDQDYGVVYLAEGTDNSKAVFNILDGVTLKNTTANYTKKGCILGLDAKSIVNMYGGKITGASTSSNGGGVYNSGAFNMFGGSITGNYANYGGGIHINYGTVTIAGGSVTGNTASSKGASSRDVYLVSGSLVAEGGTVGYVRAQNNKNITLNGAVVLQALDLKGTGQLLLKSGGALTSDARITVAAAANAKIGSADLVPYFNTEVFRTTISNKQIVAKADDGIYVEDVAANP